MIRNNTIPTENVTEKNEGDKINSSKKERHKNSENDTLIARNISSSNESVISARSSNVTVRKQKIHQEINETFITDNRKTREKYKQKEEAVTILKNNKILGEDDKQGSKFKSYAAAVKENDQIVSKDRLNLS